MKINPITKQLNMKGQYISHNSKQVMTMSDTMMGKDLNTFTTLPVYKTNFSNINFKGGRELLEAAAKGDLETVKEELEKGTDINYIGYYGNGFRVSALMLAVICNHCDIIDELIAHNELDINQQADDKTKYNALHHACINPSPEPLIYLLRHPDVDKNIASSLGTAKDICELYNRPVHRDLLHYYPRNVDGRLKVYRNNTAFYPVKVNKIFKNKIDLNKPTPEENIWTKEEISAYFLELVRSKDFNTARLMMEKTPLIDFAVDNNKIMKEISLSQNDDFIVDALTYLKDQPKRLQEYEERRKIFLEQTISNLSYQELKKHPIITTPEGFKILMGKEEFNPNDKFLFNSKQMSLFHLACLIDSEGNLSEQILAQYDNVDTSISLKNDNIQQQIDEYDNFGRFEFELSNPEKQKEALQKIERFIDSDKYNPTKRDSLKNNFLHIISQIPSQKRILKKLVENDKITDKKKFINEKNVAGETPIMSAIKILAITSDLNERAGLMENISFMIDNDADLNAIDNQGNSVWHYVCKASSELLIMLTTEKGINGFLKDAAGKLGFEYLPTQELKAFCLERFIGKVKI